jgi:hypothetical protein
MRVPRLLLGALTALTITAANAAEVDYDSANFLLPYCKSFLQTTHQSNDLLYEHYCLGVVNTLAFMGRNSDVAITAFSGQGQQRFISQNWRCLDAPDGVTTGQMIRVIIRYIEARPQRMHEPFRSLALEALFDAWPCK